MTNFVWRKNCNNLSSRWSIYAFQKLIYLLEMGSFFPKHNFRSKIRNNFLKEMLYILISLDRYVTKIFQRTGTNLWKLFSCVDLWGTYLCSLPEWLNQNGLRKQRSNQLLDKQNKKTIKMVFLCWYVIISFTINFLFVCAIKFFFFLNEFEYSNDDERCCLRSVSIYGFFFCGFIYNCHSKLITTSRPNISIRMKLKCLHCLSSESIEMYAVEPIHV